jgi:hypothetical protein
MRNRMAAAFALAAMLSGTAEARSLVVAVPANMSPETAEDAETFFTALFDGLQPRDTLVVFDATHLTIAAQVTAPDNLGTDPKARARVFGAARGSINDLLEQAARDAVPDDLNIPVLLRELGLNVIPQLPDKDDLHILLIGSILWQSKDANWSFREYVPSDGFLVQPVGIFRVSGQESLLAGSITSICYTDKIDGFQWEGFRQQTIDFWGKSIVGRGGKVGGIQPLAADCVARLFSPVEDKTPYVIDRHADVFLRKAHWVKVDVR